MQWGEQTGHAITATRLNKTTVPIKQSSPVIPPIQPESEIPAIAAGFYTTTPPISDQQILMPRLDDINTIQRMFSDPQTNAVMLVGGPGIGKSTLAALIYYQLLAAKRAGQPTPDHLIWLTMSNYTTLPDIINAILEGVGMTNPGLFLLKPEQQISTLLRTLRRPQCNALIFLDQFELLLHPETLQGAAGRGSLSLFMEMLQNDLGSSRVLLTTYNAPSEENKDTSHIRSFLVSRISMPEGVALLQKRGVKATHEELTFIWQRCSGHVFSLVLFSVLVRLSKMPANYFLEAPEYRPMWSRDVTANLITSVNYFLSSTQNAIIHALSLFQEPAPKEGIFTTITGLSVEELFQSENAEIIGVLDQELDQLFALGLIQPVLNSANRPCYTIHPLLKEYTLEHFMEDKSDEVSEGRTPNWKDDENELSEDQKENRRAAHANGHIQVAGYYKYCISEQCPPRELRTNLREVEPIISAIRHYCLGQRWQNACDLLFEEELHEDMLQWGTWNTLIGLYTAMLPPFGSLSKRDEGLLNGYVGMLYGRIGEQKQSNVYFEQALTIQRQMGDLQGEATTLANQGELLRLRGEYQQARNNFEHALERSSYLADKALQCVVHHNLGLLSQHQRNYPQAQKHYVEALKLSYEIPKEEYQGMIMTNLGMLLYEQYHQLEALALLFAALEQRQSHNDPTAPLLERFLIAIEQKMGAEAYNQVSQEALQIQSHVFSRFVSTDMRE